MGRRPLLEASPPRAPVPGGQAARPNFRTTLGYPVFDGAELVGHFEFFDEAFLAALNVADALALAPGDLAWLLDAVGRPGRQPSSCRPCFPSSVLFVP